jgi:hypothetical protein
MKNLCFVGCCVVFKGHLHLYIDKGTVTSILGSDAVIFNVELVDTTVVSSSMVDTCYPILLHRGFIYLSGAGNSEDLEGN